MIEGEGVALYARVSSDGQARDNTIASQVAALRERVAADGFHLMPDHACVDEGYSGTICFVRRWKGCGMLWPLGSSREFISTPRTGSPGAMHIKCFSSRSFTGRARMSFF